MGMWPLTASIVTPSHPARAAETLRQYTARETLMCHESCQHIIPRTVHERHGQHCAVFGDFAVDHASEDRRTRFHNRCSPSASSAPPVRGLHPPPPSCLAVPPLCAQAPSVSNRTASSLLSPSTQMSESPTRHISTHIVIPSAPLPFSTRRRRPLSTGRADSTTAGLSAHVAARRAALAFRARQSVSPPPPPPPPPSRAQSHGGRAHRSAPAAARNAPASRRAAS